MSGVLEELLNDGDIKTIMKDRSESIENSRNSLEEDTMKEKRQKYVIDNLILLSNKQLDKVIEMIKGVKFIHGK